MAGAPDWTIWEIPVIPIDTEPVPQIPENEEAGGGVGRWSGTGAVYNTVVSWAIADGKIGELKEIVVITDDYAKTHFRIYVGAVTFATDWIMTAPIPLIFEDLRIEGPAQVIVQAKSTDGTLITADAAIVGKVIG